MATLATSNAAQDQQLRALEFANRVRLARARMKRKVAAGELPAAEVIMSCPWQAHTMEVSDLLMSQRRWGRTRCRRMLVSLGVPENKQIGTLTERQRLALSAGLSAKNAGAAGPASEQPRSVAPAQGLTAARARHPARPPPRGRGGA